MGKTAATRIDEDLFAEAKAVAPMMSRSAAQQIAHWARIGREVEGAASTSQRAVAEVLAGARDYDSLSAREQAVVRAEWAERMDERRAALDLARDFAAEGRSYVELDEHGQVVRREPRQPRTA